MPLWGSCGTVCHLGPRAEPACVEKTLLRQSNMAARGLSRSSSLGFRKRLHVHSHLPQPTGCLWREAWAELSPFWGLTPGAEGLVVAFTTSWPGQARAHRPSPQAAPCLYHNHSCQNRVPLPHLRSAVGNCFCGKHDCQCRAALVWKVWWGWLRE